MTADVNSDLARLMGPVALAVLGKPNASLSTKSELRFGSNGSLSVDLSKGTFFDHETQQGGGVIALVEREKGLKGRDVFEWMTAQGFDVPDRRDDDRTSRNGAAPARADGRAKREIEATYDYTDADGNLLFQAIRWVFRKADGSFEMTKDGAKKRKTFTQRRPAMGEKNVWINGLDAGEYMRRGAGSDWFRFDEDKFSEWKCTERRHFEACNDSTIYRLPQLMEAIAYDNTVYIVEGEKKADLLWSWGFAATCNAGGSKKWRAEFAEFLRGADVVILPDNDEQARDKDGKPLFNPDGSPRIAGRDHADKVATSLNGVARRVRGLDLPGLPVKGDIVDWRDAGGTSEKLIELTETLARPWRKQPFVSRFGAVAFENIDAPGPEVEPLIDDWLTVGDKSVIGGASKSGKSFLAIHAGMCIALGATKGLPANFKLPDVFGHKVMAPGLVIYQAGEGARGVKQRLRAFRNHFGVPAGTRVPFVLLQSRVDLYRPDGDTAALVEEIKGIASLYDVPLRALFIDTLATATGGADENSGKDMSTVMSNIDRMSAAFTGCHVSLVHHMNAAGTKLRGHSSIYANIDQVILVDRDEDTKIRTAVLDKSKDGEDGLSFQFELLSIELGRRQGDGKEITSCVCVQVGEKAKARQARSEPRGFKINSNQHAIALRALCKALQESGVTAPADLKDAPKSGLVVEYKHWRDAYWSMSPIDADTPEKAANNFRQAVKRSGEFLVRCGIIGRHNGKEGGPAENWVWLAGKHVEGFPMTKPKPEPALVPEDEYLAAHPGDNLSDLADF